MEMNKKALVILSAGHLVTDLNQGSLPVLLPFFKETFDLSYTLAGVILLFANLTSSVIQPAFGYLSDKYTAGWLLPISPFLACLGMSLTGLFPAHLPLLLAAVMVSGLGIAGYHPEGYKTAYFFTGQKKATGMAIFSVGGNLGMALGPIWALTLVTLFGLEGTLGMIVPGLALGATLLLSMPWLTTPIRSALARTRPDTSSAIDREHILAFSLLIAIVIIRSWIQFGLLTYIPFYYINFLKGDPLYAGKLVSTFLMTGALGTLLGAPLADRWGHKKFMTATMVVMIPLLLLFYNVGQLMAFLVLGVAGMILVSSFTVTVVMAQVLLPKHVGMASGLMVGFAVGTGGIGVTLLGIIADHWGVPTAIKSILVLPFLGFILSLLIKYPPNQDDEKG
jgi:FSR family fosmidomycin resistance protein-like MFS transporter